VDHRVDVVAGEQEGRLPGRAREPVDDETVIPVMLVEAGGDQPLRYLVGHELPGVHHIADLPA
jgi:hypothetical protein